MDSLLFNLAAYSQYDHLEFIPEDVIESTLTRENINNELIRCNVPSSPGLTDFVYFKAKKTFAILVLNNRTIEIVKFQEGNFTDSLLPIKYDRPFVRVESLAKNPNGESNTICVFQSWALGDIIHFESNQWRFIAPIIGESSTLSEYPERTILPFTSTGEQRGGGFSIVSKIQIHAAHQPRDRLVDGEPKDMALKEPDSESRHADRSMLEAMYTQESSILTVFQELHDDHLIKVFARFKRGWKSFFIFEWAEGGNLRDFWKRQKPRVLDVDLIIWVLKQFMGLSKAIHGLHKLYLKQQDAQQQNDDHHCRHGDLKPENILVFFDPPGAQNVLGRLVIADVGLAKVHYESTRKRHQVPTRTMTGTQRYEPPDVLNEGQARSRSYDIWSMGCICLEFIIWLLYDTSGLEKFNTSFESQRFWDAPKTAVSSSQAWIQPEVQRWIKWMRDSDNRVKQGTALGDLLRVVETRLLVIRYDIHSSEESDSQSRARSKEFSEAISRIHDLAVQESPYLQDCTIADVKIRAGPPPVEDMATTQRYSKISTQHLPVPGQLSYRGRIPSQELEISDLEISETVIIVPPDVRPRAEYELNDLWDTVPSNDFALRLFRRIDCQDVLPHQQEFPRLCERCSQMDIWEDGFSTQDRVIDLRARALVCRLCKLFYNCAEDWLKSGRHTETIQFYRMGSAFHLERYGQPVLSIYTTPASYKLPQCVQVGFPKLPDPGSATQIELFHEWLKVCDDPKQHHCNPTLGGPLPTRVLDVGGPEEPSVLRLHHREPGETGKYIALSHLWGDPSIHRNFCTERANLSNFHNSIDFAQLPKTFQDAIIISRKLGIRFLWIDSLCIIQDDPDDWESESKRMEDVFNFAYCTIAASCARGTADGFLSPRLSREVITVKQASGNIYYVRKAIDNFGADVEEGELNQRGWVLQERALSHRTIHFTETQVYWECGDGVHCETLTKMRKYDALFFGAGQLSKSAILGDSEFPKSAQRFLKGGRIRLYEFIYKRYSTLAFTSIADRSIAISGLEKRLIRTFNTIGGYGIFEEYLDRSLLWQRASSEMSRILYPRRRKVPSWSFVAYAGPIKYVDIPFGQVDWFHDIQSPFRHNAMSSTATADCSNDGSSPIVLTAMARDLLLRVPRKGLHRVILDQEGMENHVGLKCVVIARDRLAASLEIRKFYILVIALNSSDKESKFFERVGAGFVEKHQIDFKKPASRVQIQ